MFIPNDIQKSLESPITIITGANYSGKSVYLKQVALIIFMSHVGCFCPCDPGGQIGIVDRIFVRMQNSNYNTIGTSTFFTDVQQVTHAFKNMTRHSVLLIDEFGKGTDVNVGISMFAGLVQYLNDLAIKGECPRAFMATHFNEVVQFSLLDPISTFVKWKMMDIILDNTETNSGSHDNVIRAPRLTFLYRLVDGQATQSWGVHCAKLAGLPQEVLKRASEISLIYSPFLPLSSILPEYSNEERVILQQKIHHFFSWCDNNTDNWNIQTLKDLTF